MNKQQQPISFSKLIEKLRNEYDQLKERVDSLGSFLCDIDFEKRVPDPVEQRLMREQLHMMLGYMNNLRARISYNEEQQIRNRLETGDGKRGLDFVRCDNGKVVAIVPEGLIPEGLDDIDPNKVVEVIKKSWCDYKGRLEDCGQDACCQVDAGNADVDMPVLTGESLKTLMDYKVVNVCVPKCKDCPCGDGLREYPSGRDMSSCVKLELVGGAYLYLAPLPNSIVTD